jgi:hypothetical protein
MNLELVPALQHQSITTSTFGTQLGSRASSTLDPAAAVQKGG